MPFVRCSEEQAKTFVDFLLTSGQWASCDTGRWEAFRLIKTATIDEGSPVYSSISTIVIHKNLKGVHSFDPRHQRAFMESEKRRTADIKREANGE
jgi:hypothetical protein